MSHIYIDGTKITANANKGNDQLLPEYNIQQCKQKNTETHFFVNLGFLICCFFTAPFVERMMGIEPTRSMNELVEQGFLVGYTLGWSFGLILLR